MKKRLSLVLTLCLLLIYCLTLTSCSTLVSYIHKCEFSTEWSKDAESHWHACTFKFCEQISDKAPHDWDEGVITTKATQEADGEKNFTCKVCSETKAEAVAFTGFSEQEWDAAFTSSVFNNFSFKEIAITSSNGVSVTSELDYKFTKNAAWAKMTVAGSTEEEYVSDTKSVEQARKQLIDSIKDFAPYESFKYDANTKTYKATEDIYVASAGDYASDVTLTFEYGKLVEIKYSISFVESGATYTVTSTVTLSDYGTTVVNPSK